MLGDNPMIQDNYTTRQTQLNRQYRNSYQTPEVRAWIESLTPEQRRKLQSDGLLEPMIDHTYSGHSQDAADLPEASYEPDIAAHIDPPDSSAATGDSGDLRSDTLASFCARIRSIKNPLLVFDAVCFATGVLALDGASQTELAKRHGVSRAAFSKIATQWCKTFGIKPSRGMKSEKARNAYKSRAKANWQRRSQPNTSSQVDAAPK